MLLQVQFEYPDILRQPTADVLTKFQAGGPRLVAIWYALTLTAVLFIPVVVLVHHIMATAETSATLWVATVFGVVAGVVQALGFLRWPFLVPHTVSRQLVSIRQWQPHRQLRALAGLALHLKVAIICMRHITSDRQANPASRAPRSVEHIEELRQIGRVNP